MAARESAASLAMVTIDCADPKRQAEFWAAVLGWEITYSEGDYGMIGDGSQRVGFGRVEGWKAPGWPNAAGTKQFHFDLAVEDLETAEKQIVALGASKPAEQPSTDWVVLLDPDGHPFCLTKAANWG